jgi:D-lactate dehydrogenase
MKILFYDAKKYDKESFDKEAVHYPEIQITYLETDISPTTAVLAKGYDAICAFVSSDLGEEVLSVLADSGVGLLLLRCAGFNNVNLKSAEKYNITILRVPGYSPEAVAEFSIALALAVGRRLHKSYIKVRENNFALTGLTGVNFYGKTAGIIGTGKIGTAMCRICHGMGMKVVAYDKYPNHQLEFVTYKEFDDVLAESDLVSLHCPLTEENYHLICADSIQKMKDNVILVNTSRGGLVNTKDLIQGIRAKKFFGVALDVYEEETENVFENREDDILDNSVVARLLSFPNVIVASHQGFLTEEALSAISSTTLQNAMDYMNGTIKEENSVR